MLGGEDPLGQEMNYVPDGNPLVESPPNMHPMPKSLCLPIEEPEVQPVPVPRKRREGSFRVDTPIPPPRKSQRTTEGINRNPFNLPRSASNAVTFSPDVLSQVLAGMVLHIANLKE